MDAQAEPDENNENDDENKQNSLGIIPDILNAPMQFVKNLIPGSKKSEESEEDEDSEMVGEKLRKKRMRSKRKGNTLARRHSFDLNVRKKRFGCNRSVVRYIGSNVPLAPTERAYFEISDKVDKQFSTVDTEVNIESSKQCIEIQSSCLGFMLLNHSSRGLMSNASSFISKNYDQMRQHVDQVKHRVVPSLADLGQLMWEDLNMFNDMNDTATNDEIEHEIIMFHAENKKPEKVKETVQETSLEKPETSKQDEKKVGETAKISALEDELAKLRAQIAMIVSAQQAGNSSNTTAAQPPQVAVVPPTHIVAPPPPPPPPPPLPVIQIPSRPPLIKKESIETKRKIDSSSNMDNVIKGIASVKLKAVDISRSPGGTPLKKNPPREDSNNHADIIARALKEKFKNTKMCYDSPVSDKGSPSSSFSDSPPVFSQPKVQSRLERPVPKPRPRPRPPQQ